MGLISRHMRQIIISQSCHSFLPQDLCSCCLPCWECPSLGSSCHSGVSSQGVTSLENVLDHPLKCSPSSIKNYLMCFIFILFSSPLVQNVTFRRARILTRVKHEPSGGSDGLESITLVSSHWTTPCHSMPTPAYQAPRRDIFSSLLSPQPGHSQLHNLAVHSSSHCRQPLFFQDGTEHLPHNPRGQHSAGHTDG